MSSSTVEKTVFYAGLMTIAIKTYTTAYPFKEAGWSFNPGSPIPMEFHGYINNGNCVGLYARTIDVDAGYTTLKVGNTDSANLNSHFTTPGWFNGQIGGWALNDVTTLRPILYQYPIKPGMPDLTLKNFSPKSSLKLPIGVNNTGMPLPGFGMNMPTANGYWASGAIIDLNPFIYLSKNSGLINTADSAQIDFNISNQHFVLNRSIPLVANDSGINGTTAFVICGNPSDLTDRQQLLATDFAASIVNYVLTFQNPAGVDIDNIMTQHGANGSTFPTPNGWLYIDKATITVAGKTLNGFAVYILPDYSYYWVVEIIPTDAGTIGWQNSIGDYDGRVDLNGALFMKNANSDTTLFVSAGSVLKQLPIFFPVPVPDRPDTDPVANMMRSFQQ
jgi:hypothetical protein